MKDLNNQVYIHNMVVKSSGMMFCRKVHKNTTERLANFRNSSKSCETETVLLLAEFLTGH